MTAAAPPRAELAELADLADFVRRHPRLFVLTGAGVSTGSGIPDYRDAAGRWKRRPPVSHQDFVASAATRRRYWARSLLGWPLMARAHPNPAHTALARLEAGGRVWRLVTQNVDGLHQRAGSARVLELHGSIHRVACLDCGAAAARAAVQDSLARANPRVADWSATALPDGDADLEALDLDGFQVPACAHCGGMLKPDVVFFGAGVPRARLDLACADLDASDAMLVAGSSLMVYSGYRFCVRAAERGLPIAAINLGQTRADALFRLKLHSPCDTALPALVAALDVPAGAAALNAAGAPG
jgi:NAD-dependent SIR2 family protein deacetylase